MLIDRSNWPRHARWAGFALVATVAAAGWYGLAAAGESGWPGGSSLPGFTFGLVGGAIVLFEFLLWPRKRLRTWRFGRVEAWLRAHIWLGLLAVPLVVLHSGFRFGGTLSTVLLALFLMVVGSGLVGLALQQWLPRLMLAQVPAETIFSQIDRVLGELQTEAAELVEATCGVEAAGDRSGSAGPADAVEPPSHVAVASVRKAGRVHGRVVETISRSVVPGSALLREFYGTHVLSYLRGGGPRSLLRSESQAQAMFRDLRTKLDPAAHPAVDVLESLCDQRRQLDVEARLHFWLHSWMCVHLPLSAALVVLMGVHVWGALKYW